MNIFRSIVHDSTQLFIRQEIAAIKIESTQAGRPSATKSALQFNRRKVLHRIETITDKSFKNAYNSCNKYGK